jgi:hypothetical protein
MSLNQNQFGQLPVKGLVDLRYSLNTISCRVSSSESVALVPGQAVKLVDVAGGSPVITAVTSDFDSVFGVVNYNIRDASFAAGSAVEISSSLNIIYVEASAAIARGAAVMPVVTGQKVATATAAKTILGLALDKAAADGDLIRVILAETGSRFIFPAAAVANLNQTISATYSQAEVQAISTKVDALLAALRLSGVLRT